MTANLPPQDIAAERSVLGALLLGGRKFSDVNSVVTAADFYSDIHGTIFESIANVASKNAGCVDALLVFDDLQSAGKIEEVGGREYLEECLESVPFDAHAAYHAAIIATHARRRRAIAIGEKLIRDAHDLAKDDQELIQTAHDSAMRMAEILRVKNSRPRPIAEHVSELIDAYAEGKSPARFWGIHEIDQMIGGTMPGEMIVIGARPSMGKSMVALQWVDQASLNQVPGLIISEEMAAESLASRSLSSITDVPSNDWHSQIDRIRFDSREHFANRAPVLIAEKCATATGAERAIARAVQSHGIGIVAVDYCQLLRGNGESKESRVADVSARMKACAMKHGLILLLLAQLNRQIETRKDAPQLSDLRDSGGLEQDADIVLLPFWPFKFDDGYKDQSEYRIYCRKNRNRGIGEHVIKMRVRPDRQRIEGIAPESFDYIDRSFA